MRKISPPHPGKLISIFFPLARVAISNSEPKMRQRGKIKREVKLLPKKGAWKKKITKACESAGTYEPYFDEAIKALAEVLEKRDAAEQEYKGLGSKPIIEHTNKSGATNLTKNPALVLWDELNKTALSYWRDLGLTPSGYKKIMGDRPQEEKQSALAEALKNIGG